MKISEFIAELEKTLKEHGDLQVITPDDGCGCCSYGYIPASPEVRKDAYGLDIEKGTYLVVE